MPNGREYRFSIDAYTPDTLPMARLAEYMGDLAQILGEPASVHFVRLEKGSAILVQRVEEPAVPKIEERIRGIRAGAARSDIMSYVHRVDSRLKQDNSIGLLTDESGAEIIRFPGREAIEAATYDAFNQAGALDGVVYRIGGKGSSVPVHIQASEREYTCCAATRELAKTLAGFIFGPELRLYGEGRWLRTEDGDWELQRFSISHFEPLNDLPLSAVVAQLRDAPGNEWVDEADPWKTLLGLREEDEAT